jgi:hypothetical protein
MSVSIGAFSTSKLIAQPFGYDETSTRDGLTARKWTVSGLLSASEWQSLLSVYNTWRDARLTDADTVSSGTVGTTVSLTASANGISVSGVACWFSSAPSGDQAGPYIQASCELVDAAQSLEVLLQQKEQDRQRDEAIAKPDLGTVTLGSATLTLLAPMETYQDTPQLQLTTSGTHVINGALTATRVRRIRGTTDSTGWTAVRSWYETSVASVPTTGTWFPISAPTAEAEVIISGGAKSTRYTITVDAAEVK